ncbi:hypothetical protein CKM354_001118300 [Cercospora kikuchii]|uniref:Uncharacterized protein n=1 Tax=Cercospora kikuchii TaxID=84275 RepID=A0A9P3CWL9_9PEZI|nr:uncharacterized protein CKM354_001118300 [Cercospora kikuchii]GIZ48110.1 hypothetical protein CKM354_001118300 [Cercospora kikuchii]
MASAKRRRAANDVDGETGEASHGALGGLNAVGDSSQSRSHRDSIERVNQYDTAFDGEGEDEDEEWVIAEDIDIIQSKVTTGCTISKAQIEKANTAVPCHGDFAAKRTYKEAHRSRPRMAAYLSFDDLADQNRLILSAAFLPAYAVFKEVGLVPFREIESFLRKPAELKKCAELGDDLLQAVDERRADGDEAPQLLAYAVWWLVHKSIGVNDWSHVKQDVALDNAYEALRAHYPAIDAVPSTYRALDSASPIWQHPQDPEPQVEQYSRALQLLRCVERAEHVRINMSTTRTRAEKWVDVYRSARIFETAPISSELVPGWMKEQVDEDDVATDTQDSDEDGQVRQEVAVAVEGPTAQSPQHPVSEGDHVQQQMQDEEAMEGVEQNQGQERLEHDPVAQRKSPLGQQIKGENYATPIVIIDDRDIKVEDHDAPPDTIQLGNQSPSKSACSIVYVTSRKFSRFRCKNKKWFDECWEQMEYLDAPTNNMAASTDPRDWSTSEEWRDAVRKELHLGTHWRRGADEGLALRLTSLRLQADGEKLDCYDCKAEQFSSSPKRVWEFVEKHQHCELEYCIDFFTDEEMADGRANDLETSQLL